MSEWTWAGERSYWNAKLPQIILSSASSDKRERESVLQEGTNKRAAKKRKEVWRSFSLQTEVKRHESGHTELKRSKQAKQRTFAPHLLSALLRFTRLLPGHFFWTVHFFHLFGLLLSSETRGLNAVSLICLTHYIIGAKTPGYFPRRAIFVSIPLWSVCSTVCFDGHVNRSFHLSLWWEKLVWEGNEIETYKTKPAACFIDLTLACLDLF